MIRVRRRRGGYEVAFGLQEALILQSLPDRLRHILENPEFNEAVSGRLFPMAYRDPEKDAEYRRLLGSDLLDRKLEAVRTIERNLEGARLHRDILKLSITGEEFEYWLGFLNDFRLMLGTDLEISEDDWERELDPEDPRAGDYFLLHFLSWLQEELLSAGEFEIPRVRPEDLEED